MKIIRGCLVAFVLVLVPIPRCSGYSSQTVFSGSAFTDDSLWNWQGSKDAQGGAIPNGTPDYNKGIGIMNSPKNRPTNGQNISGLYSYTQLSTNFFSSTFTTIPMTNVPGKRWTFNLRSVQSFTPNTLIMIQMSRMPDACGTWPAIWLYSPANDNKPQFSQGGEIDILEGVNGWGSAYNRGTLHTKPGCNFTNAPSPTFDGVWESKNCDFNINGNQGCVQRANFLNSFGRTFNANGGGWFAVEWTQSSSTPSNGMIRMWFIPASAGYTWHSTVDPSQFPSTASKYSEFDLGSPYCDASSFNNLVLILDNSICGGYPNVTWVSSGCKDHTGSDTCEGYYQSNPNIDPNALQFKINSITIYK